MKTDEGLSAIFERSKGDLSDLNWKTHAAELFEYVYNPDRNITPIDHNIICGLLHMHWGVPCIKIESAIHGIGFLRTTGRQLGRLSVRILDLLGSVQTYIVLDQRAKVYELRLALLHELGHLALHFEILQSISTLYHRICLNPALEMEVGRFINDKTGCRLREIQELEADLFALTWFLPLWLDGNHNKVYPKRNIPKNLSLDGYKFKLFRDIFSDQETFQVTESNITDLNVRGIEMRQRQHNHPYPVSESLIQRLSWIIFHRVNIFDDISQERRNLLSMYFRVVGPPRYVPELTRKSVWRLEPDPFYKWIPRVESDNIDRVIDMDHWEPILTIPNSEDQPNFYIPITPVPSTNQNDSQVTWRHMMKPAHSLPLTLTNWLDRAHQQRAGLLVFPRNPAEKLWDKEALIR